MNIKQKLKMLSVLKVCVFIILLMVILGCRPLSKFFDPNKNALTKKVVQRDKPNLSETESREPDVDPDSDELQEETEDPPKKSAENTNTNTESNTNTATENKENDNTNQNQENADLGKTAAVEKFTKSLIGTWINEREKVIVNQNRMIFYADGELITDTPYLIVDEKTVEFRDGSGKKNRATMSIEDNNTTLVWDRPDLNEVFRYKRVAD